MRHISKTLLVVVFAGGMIFIGCINVFFDYTNRTEFCVSCHSMQQNHEEYKKTVHYKNASGVQASCADCHVPKSFFPKVYAKIAAASDVYHELVGTISTPEKFEDRKMYLAEKVWDKMKANDSRECRACHSFDNMKLEAQAELAGKKHARAGTGETYKTCIECHTGIAHTEP